MIGQVATSQDPPPDLTDIVLSTVVLVSPADSDSYGSGTFITPYGHILTNHHVVELPDGTVAEHSFIRVSESFTSEPVFRYVAQIVAADKDLDIAILKVVADSSFRSIPSVQRFPYLPVGDRSELRPGQRIVVWGYPGISGRTITSTEGTISGFVGEDRRSSGDRWIKTDAQVAPGNSGGAAITTEGILVGIPTVITGQALTEDIAVSQNWLRPADLFLEVVANLPGTEIVSLQTGQVTLPRPAVTDTTNPDTATEEAVIDLDKVVTTSEELMARLPLGGLITVAEGNFQLTQPIEIRTSTRIIGDGSAYTFIVSSAEGHALRVSEGETFRLEGVTIQHVEGVVADVVEVRGGQLAEFVDVRLLGAVYDEVLDRGGSGLLVRGSGKVTIFDSYFGRNGKAGLRVDGQATVTAGASTFERNEGFGVVIANGSFMLDGSEVQENEGSGLRVEGSPTVTVSDSRFNANLMGVEVRDRAQLNMVESVMSDNDYCGLQAGNDAIARLERSEIRMNSRDEEFNQGGLCVFESSDVSGVDLEILQNGQYGVFINHNSSGSLDLRDSVVGGLSGRYVCWPGAGCQEQGSLLIINRGDLNIVNNRLQEHPARNATYELLEQVRRRNTIGN